MGKEWTTTHLTDTQTNYITYLTDNFIKYHKHDKHTQWSKKQIRKLKRHLPENGVIVKCDFIEHIVHERDTETSQSLFGKRQSQFLSVVLWYWKTEANGETKVG